MLVSLSAYAKHAGVHQGTVTKWKDGGLLVMVEDPERVGRWLVDVEGSDRRVSEARNPLLGRPSGGLMSADQDVPDSSDSALKRARLDNIRASTEMRELQVARLAGDLVALSEYERRASELGRLVRERLQSAFRQEAERLAAERDSRAVMTLCSGLIDRILTEIADQVESEAQAEAAMDEALIDDLDLEEQEMTDLEQVQEP